MTTDLRSALQVLCQAAESYATYLEDMDDSHADEIAEIDEALVVVKEFRNPPRPEVAPREPLHNG